MASAIATATATAASALPLLWAVSCVVRRACEDRGERSASRERSHCEVRVEERVEEEMERSSNLISRSRQNALCCAARTSGDDRQTTLWREDAGIEGGGAVRQKIKRPLAPTHSSCITTATRSPQNL